MNRWLYLVLITIVLSIEIKNPCNIIQEIPDVTMVSKTVNLKF